MDIALLDRKEYIGDIELVEEIDTGSFSKYHALVRSDIVPEGRYIFKTLGDEDSARNQYIKCEKFRAHHVAVPEVFLPVVLDQQYPGVLVNNIEVEPNGYVLSPNNHELHYPDVQDSLASTSKDTRSKIFREMVRVANIANLPSMRFYLQPNAFMLSLHRANPDLSRIYLADFVPDVTQCEKPGDLFQSNVVYAAAWFMKLVFGELPQFDQTSEYAYLYKVIMKGQ